ncbi:MAG: hypothetical protein OXU45_05470 [Candidatus Melainabacteria bacterium]|nr:hypothetical protein [Candidatus Melainabacteria bacterium]
MIQDCFWDILKWTWLFKDFDDFRIKAEAKKEAKLDSFIEDQKNPERRDVDKWLHLSKDDATYAIAKVLDLTLDGSIDFGFTFISDLMKKHQIKLKSVWKVLDRIRSPVLLDFSKDKNNATT